MVGSCHMTGAARRSSVKTSCGKPFAKRSRSVRSMPAPFGISATDRTLTAGMPNLEDFAGDFRAYNQAVVDEFRDNRGQVTGMFAGAPLVLLTTTGAKSGTRRTTPVVSTRDPSGNVVVIASKGGAPSHPDWYHNISANPMVTVEVPGETYEARARITSG